MTEEQKERHRIRNRKWYQNNKNKSILKYNLEHKEEIKNTRKKWWVEHSEEMALKKKIYREKNKDYIKLKNKEYYINNKEKEKARSIAKRLQRQNRIPKWADLEHIREIYKNCPIDSHVDHIVPINGKNVCGLHVEYNLQYLEKKENLSKGNKFPHGPYTDTISYSL